jgi:hypothetical protein
MAEAKTATDRLHRGLRPLFLSADWALDCNLSISSKDPHQMPLDAPPSSALDQAAQAPSLGWSADDSVPNAPVSDRNSSARESRGFFRWFSKRRYDPNAIRDMRFINQVTTLISLKMFLLTEAVDISPEDAPLFSFGALYQLRYSDGGRLPTIQEWELLDKRSLKLFSYLDEERKKRFQLKQAANLIAGLPILLIVTGLVSLMLATLTVDRNLLLLAYFFWTMCLGAIGAIAFLSVNALSIQNDVGDHPGAPSGFPKGRAYQLLLQNVARGLRRDASSPCSHRLVKAFAPPPFRVIPN